MAALWGLARAAGFVLLLFTIAGVIALILNPLVELLERRRLPHGVAVFAVYIGLLAALVGVGAVLHLRAAVRRRAVRGRGRVRGAAVAAILRETMLYLRRHAVPERWHAVRPPEAPPPRQPLA